jgi:putative membrane protein insertion efficiency factor
MLSRLLLTLVRSYQLLLSPWFGDCCRFEPSCSSYCSACLEHHGALRGSWLSLKRLLRCNPLFTGGIDMPPLPAGSNARSLEPNWARLSQRIDHASQAAQPQGDASVDGPCSVVAHGSVAHGSVAHGGVAHGGIARGGTAPAQTSSRPLSSQRVQPPFLSTTER